jgi:hypothetical protein
METTWNFLQKPGWTGDRSGHQPTTDRCFEPWRWHCFSCRQAKPVHEMETTTASFWNSITPRKTDGKLKPVRYSDPYSAGSRQAALKSVQAHGPAIKHRETGPMGLHKHRRRRRRPTARIDLSKILSVSLADDMEASIAWVA